MLMPFIAGVCCCICVVRVALVFGLYCVTYEWRCLWWVVCFDCFVDLCILFVSGGIVCLCGLVCLVFDC